ncbi:MAG TPA: enhanced serine sensitivity protein SseB C-terminal domain-containing protein [Tepidisphaeraceae bacterium]|nr:enhanced serine sensitivity protein SseB C-terminal domain-containing protein [Tepidisphaeraceae bacterium]
MNFLKRWFGRGREFPENLELRQAIIAVATDDSPDTRTQLYQRLLDAQLYLATPDEPEHEETGQLQEGQELRLVLLHNHAGQTIWPVFTDLKAIAEWRSEGGGYIGLPGRVVFDMMASTDAAELIVNPGSTAHGSITAAEAQLLAQGSIPQFAAGGGIRWQITGPTQMILGSPANPPAPELVQRLQAELASHPHIASAYLFQAVLSGGAPHLMVGLYFLPNIDPEAVEQILHSVGSTARLALSEGQYIDIVTLNDPMLHELQQMMSPLYQAPHTGIVQL